VAVAEVVQTFEEVARRNFTSSATATTRLIETLDEFRYDNEMTARRPDRLKRLPPEYYRGEAWVHWILTIDERRTGWLDAKFLYRFRELLTHSAFRYQVACPIFTLMPDHMHLLWAGLSSESDQLPAMKNFRKNMNDSLKRIGFEFQRQPYDHVLKDDELELTAIEEVAEYIARNPERKGLVGVDEFANYSYTGCLLPGAPLVRLFGERGWDEVWVTMAFLKRTECYRKPDPKYDAQS